MNKLTQALIDLTPEVGQWSARNFPDGYVYDTVLGMIEELGELSHAVLKARQGIRGTHEQHKADAIDAMCDFCIFGMDFLYRSGMYAENQADVKDWFFSSADKTFDVLRPISEESIINPHACVVSTASLLGMMAAACIDRMSSDDDEKTIDAMCDVFKFFSSILLSFDTLAKNSYGVDLSDEIRKTWAKVKTRDWQKNPATAHAVAEASA